MLAVIGDFDAPSARRTIESLFARPAISESRPASRPSLRPGSFEGFWDVRSHQLFMFWPAPSPPEKSHPAMSLLAPLLRSALKRSSEIAKEVLEVKVHEDAGGFFVIQTPLRTQTSGSDVAREIGKVLGTIAADPLRYLDATKDELRSGWLIPDLASAPMEVRSRCPRSPARDPPDRRVSRDVRGARRGRHPDDIHAAIKTYLAPEKATIVTIAGKE